MERAARLLCAVALCSRLGAADAVPLGHARHLLIYDPSGMHLAIILMVCLPQILLQYTILAQKQRCAFLQVVHIFRPSVSHAVLAVISLSPKYPPDQSICLPSNPLHEHAVPVACTCSN